MDFKSILVSWYLENRRDLPWRHTKNPYYIWVSEVILQQTRVAQGLSYYQQFIKSFPTITALAAAHEDSVLKVWQGLGYYTRARNLHKAAKLIVNQHDGNIPEEYNELIKIKGIGAYSAGAIASFAFKKAVPAIDGNVYRIIARIFGVFSLPTSAQGKREFFQIVTDLMDKKSPDTFNQALLDFGALQCVPKSPKCGDCPFQQYCYAYRNNMIDSLPVKGKKLVPRHRYFTYLLIRYGYYTFIYKRQSKDIWHSLYEFPLIETDKEVEPIELHKNDQWNEWFGCEKVTINYISDEFKHLLSHQTLHTRFVIVKIDSIPQKLTSECTMVPTTEIDNYSTPKLIDNFLAAEPATKYFLSTHDKK
jgi:A/G-specific adenine glycosylase